jgi:DNA-binding LytR/AlgR family response regulator
MKMNKEQADAEMDSLLRFPGFVRVSEDHVINVKKVMGVDEYKKVLFLPDKANGKEEIKVDEEYWWNFIIEYNSRQK